MKSTALPISQTGFFTNLVLDYLNAKPSLSSYYKYPVAIESFSKIIADKKNQKTDRNTLVTVLRDQYKDLTLTPSVKSNIESLLNINTFTITAAHQPNLFLGPLYYLYKIVSVINLAKQVQLKNPGNTIIPVFLIGSEDHDVAELAQVTISGKKIEWNPNQSGAFGRMKTTGLETVIEEVKALLGSYPDAENSIALLKKIYDGKNTIAEATRLLIDSLFGKYGLVVVDGDDARLKTFFTPVIEEELLNQRAEKLLTPIINDMEKEYTVQAKPRPINLFYLKDDIRSRIEKTDANTWSVINTSITFSESELKNEIASHPERFSPNVILRGLYQEMILPNLAFIGGGAEVSYWLELKPLFEFIKVNYPMVVLRASGLLLDKTQNARIQKFGFSIEELFQPTEALIKNYVRKTSSEGLQLNGLRKEMEELFTSLKTKAIAIDPTLEASVMAEKTKADKGLENIEQKMIRAEKRKQEDAVGQITSLKEKLFPGSGLQERVENFLPFYLKYGSSLIGELVSNFDPLQKNFMVTLEG